MAAVDDVIGAIDAVISKIDETDGSVDSAVHEAGEAIDKAEAVGDPGPVGQFSQVKSSLEELKTALAAVKKGADEALGVAQAIKSGT